MMRLGEPEYYADMTIENEAWKHRVEPRIFEKSNSQLSQYINTIAPGLSNNLLACAVLTIKPSSLQHLDMSHEQIRDYWLSKSESSVKPFIHR